MKGRFLRPVRELELETILAGRERERAFVAEHSIFDGVEALLGDRIRDGFLLREDEFVLGTKNTNADFHRVGIASVFLLSHAKVARTMQTDGIVEARQSPGIASGEGNNVEIAALEDQS